MGERGPARMPSPLAKLRGSTTTQWRRRDEISVPTQAPDPPEWLGEVAREEWDRVAPLLESLGLLARIDRATLTCYCAAWENFVKYEKDIAKNGVTFTSANGHLCQRTEVAERNKARDALLKYGRQFGMSPSARSGLPGEPVTSPGEILSLDEFIEKRGAGK